MAEREKWRKFFFSAFLILLFLIWLSAEGRRRYFVKGELGIEDTADVLTNGEELMLTEILASFTDYCSVFVYTQEGDVRPAEEMLELLLEKYMDKQKMYQKGSDKYRGNGILFYIDAKDRTLRVVASGRAARVITKRHEVRIAESAAQYASAGIYYTCITKAADRTERLLAVQSIGQVAGELCILLLSAVLAVLLMLAHVTETAARWKADNDRD